MIYARATKKGHRRSKPPEPPPPAVTNMRVEKNEEGHIKAFSLKTGEHVYVKLIEPRFPK